MDVISDKIDASLQLALQLPTEELEKSGSLSAGYEKESQSWELILRLAGSVQTLRQAFPQASFQELSGGYVTALVPEDAIEALAAGIPAIAPDICGFPESVPDGCGIRFPARNPKEFITGLRDGIVRLYRNEAERRALCCNAKVRVREFSWERKAELLKQDYSAKLRMKNCQQ